jgi:hypothetical protein
MAMEDPGRLNRACWDERVPIHVASDFYDVDGFRAGRLTLQPFEVEEVGEQLMKILEIGKVRGASKTTGNIVTFDVEPELGMKIIPISKAAA